MMVRPGNRFCGEHAAAGETAPKPDGDKTGNTRTRIPCPYDPKHTVDSLRLEKHLKKCCCKPGALPEYCLKGVNMPKTTEPDPKVSINTISDEKLLEVIGKVNRVYESEKVADHFEELILDHPVLIEEMKNSPHFGPGVLKHLKQNSSLLGHLQKEDLLTVCNFIFVSLEHSYIMP